MTRSDYGLRAAAALNTIVPGPNRDKLVARAFGVSVRMAQYLRAGQFWTLDRLNEASAKFGVAFDALLISQDDVHHRLDALQAELDELRKNIRGAGDDE